MRLLAGAQAALFGPGVEREAAVIEAGEALSQPEEPLAAGQREGDAQLVRRRILRAQRQAQPRTGK